MSEVPDEATFEVPYEYSEKELRPNLKTQSEAREIEGAPPGKWWIKQIVTELKPPNGITVMVKAVKTKDW